MQDPREREIPARGKVLVVLEVAQAVSNQVAAIPLHTAKDVRTTRDDEVRTLIDRVVGEEVRIAPIFSDVVLVRSRDVIGAGTFGAGVHINDHDLSQSAGSHNEFVRDGVVQKIVGVGVGREVNEGDFGSSFAHHRDLAGQSGLRDARRSKGARRLKDALGPEVAGVVVRAVQDGETGRTIDVRKVGRYTKGVALTVAR